MRVGLLLQAHLLRMRGELQALPRTSLGSIGICWGSEMDRRTVDPLIVKGETVRDGDALAQQASESTFAIVLYLVALLSLSLAMWMLVMNRRIRTEGLEGGISDETQSVVDEMNSKFRLLLSLL